MNNKEFESLKRVYCVACGLKHHKKGKIDCFKFTIDKKLLVKDLNILLDYILKNNFKYKEDDPVEYIKVGD